MVTLDNQLIKFFLQPEIYTLSFPFSRILKSELLIQDLISRLIVNENKISIYQNPSLGVDNQKFIKFCKSKMLLLFNGSLYTLRSFTHPGHQSNGSLYILRFFSLTQDMRAMFWIFWKVSSIFKILVKLSNQQVKIFTSFSHLILMGGIETCMKN